MRSTFTDFERQVEILAKCLNLEIFSKSDLADNYKVSEITINRDLNVLREYGIQIYSRKNKVEILQTPTKENLIELSSNYLPIKLNSDIFKNQTKALLKTYPARYFTLLVLIAKAVNEGRIIIFKYKRLGDNEENNYTVKPVRLITNELNWILLGFKNGENVLKSFYLSRINSLAITEKKFKPVYISENKETRYKMIFQFHPEVKEEIISKIWFTEFEIKTDANDYVILTTIQPITKKLASWCISWWDTIQIVEPLKLKDYINQMIDNFKSKNL